MHPIFTAIDNKDYDSFVKIFNEDKESHDAQDDGWSILSLAVDYKMPEFVDFLLENLTEEQIKAQGNKHPLLVAIENNDLLLTSKLISNKKIIKHLATIEDSRKESILSYVHHFYEPDKKLALIQELLKYGCDPFVKNNSLSNAVSHAINNGEVDIFKEYTKHKDFNKKCENFWIIQSIRNNQPEIFNILFNLDKFDDIDNVFTNALDSGNVIIVDTILDSGNVLPGGQEVSKMIDIMCDVYDTQEENKSSLNIADFLFSTGMSFEQFANPRGKNIWTLCIENNNETIFSKLIESNELVEITDNKEQTPLFYAIKQKNPQFVKKLLEKGAYIGQKDKNNNTPLIYAVMLGNKEVVDILLSYPNTLINDLNHNNETSLSIAVKNKRMDLASSLIWKGAEISKNPAKFIEENDIFQIGANGNYEKLTTEISENEINNFIALSQLGFNLNQKNAKGDTFLLQFIKEGYLSNFKSLLKCSFNPNQIDSNGDSAIMCAMRKNHDDYSLGLLWKFNNIDFTIKNKNGEDVYDLAKEFSSAKRSLALIKKDNNLTFENLSKVLPVITMSADLKENFDFIEEHKEHLSSYVDDYKNNLLMLAVLGGNIKNFSWLLDNQDIQIDSLHKNKNNENVVDLIEKLPPEESEVFHHFLSKYLKKNHKLIPS